MKKIHILSALTLCLGIGVTMAENEVSWETLGNQLNDQGNTWFLQRFIVKADSTIDAFAFCQAKRYMVPEDSTVKILEILPGYYQIESPKIKNLMPGDSAVIDIWTSGVFRSNIMRPDGVHLVKDGKPVKTSFKGKRLTSFPGQWVDPKTGWDYMTYADEAYVINDSLRSSYQPSAYMQIPTPKNVTLKKGSVSAEKLLSKDFVIEKISDPREDYAIVDINGKGVKIKTNSKYPSAVAEMVRRRIRESADAKGNVPIAVIEDWSDYPYRGVMLDVARNFTGKEDVKNFIDLMSRYGLNVFHFHLGEDEGWRVEIPTLPELTSVGSRRGYTLTDDVPYLKGIYSGDGSPDSPTVANGHYSVEDFIEILKYADSKGIAVIPEFDTPGHSRAAIRAMEWRYKTTGDSSLRLIEDGDTSVYRGAQDFTDNIMNPAIDGPYKFWGIVFDAMIDIYNRAGVPLLAVNIGGDEVPKHAWDGSPSVQRLMKEKGMEDQKQVHAYFVERVANIAKEKGIKIAGWEEIAMKHSPEYDKNVIPVIEAVNSWNYADENAGLEMARKGYPVILSNVDYLYFDHHQTGHPDDPGMWWGGIVDEFTPLNATVDTLMPGDASIQANVKGISAQLFGETIKDFSMVQHFMLPRILGLAERAHNSKATISDNEYFGLITREMPRWEKEGLNYYVRQPGIIVKEGVVYMNEPYGFGEIRYTTDGSEPDENSMIYVSPFAIGDFKELRAKLYTGNSSSATSILYKGYNQ